MSDPTRYISIIGKSYFGVGVFPRLSLIAKEKQIIPVSAKMAEYIAIPLKKPSDVDVVKPLTNVIKSTYNSAEGQKDFADRINEFAKLRNNALWRAFEKYESSLEVIYGYESLIIIAMIRFFG